MGHTHRTSFQELNEQTAMIGGLSGVPKLVTMVSQLMPGGGAFPSTWNDWLTARIASERPFSVVFTSPDDGEVWTLVVDRERESPRE
mgnify:CR=1 FL=1